MQTFNWLLAAVVAMAAMPLAGADGAPPRSDAEADRAAQETARESPCSSAAYRQLDFWLGQWEVRNHEGTLAGRSSIEDILNGCAVQENWEGANGWSGKSFNAYDRVTGKWRQFWVSGWGAVTEFTGEASAGRMVYLADTVDRDGKPALRRVTLTRVEPDRVRQLAEMSYDGGKTWTRAYDFTYARVGPPMRSQDD
jgi:hypothetical protein